MTKREFADAMDLLLASWPNAPALSEQTLGLYWEELKDFSSWTVLSTIRVIARDGREFLPPPGLVRRRIAELLIDPQPWGEALKWLAKYDRTGFHSVGDLTDHVRAEAARVREQMPPLVQGFLESVGGAQIRRNLESGGNGEARLRTMYEQYVRDAVDSGALAGLPAPEGMRRLERANRTGPSLVGGAVQAALESGKP